MPDAATRIKTSSGPVSGTGTFSGTTCRAPRYTPARIRGGVEISVSTPARVSVYFISSSLREQHPSRSGRLSTRVEGSRSEIGYSDRESARDCAQHANCQNRNEWFEAFVRASSEFHKKRDSR